MSEIVRDKETGIIYTVVRRRLDGVDLSHPRNDGVVGRWVSDALFARIFEPFTETASPAPPTALVEPREPAQAETKKETSMNFGEAIQAMKDGKSVQRSGWNGKNMHIYLEDAFAFLIGDGVFKGQTRDYEPVICMFNAHGKHQPGWLANQPDILAEDWQVVDG